MPSYKIKRSLTKGDIVDICYELSSVFEVEFKSKYKFRPLDRVEGGIECYEWPGMLPGQVSKQVRFHHIFGSLFPVPTNWEQEWVSENEKDKVVVQHLRKVWTAEDLPNHPENKGEHWAKWFNKREQRNELYFRDIHTKWTKKERVLMVKFLREVTGLI